MSTGSQYAPYADLSLGILDSYNESSFNRINDIAYNTYEGFVQDSWKVSKRLTLELGIRMSHFQPWADRLGYGFSIFDYSQYKSSCSPTDYCGFVWHTRNASVPLGGFPTRALFYQPRFGLVYDVFGTGKTVIRGGWGRFDVHAGQFRTDWMWPPESKPSILRAQVPAVFHYWLANSTQVTRRSALSPAAVDSKDDKQPYTNSYSLTIAQRTPWSGLLDLSYVGNSTIRHSECQQRRKHRWRIAITSTWCRSVRC